MFDPYDHYAACWVTLKIIIFVTQHGHWSPSGETTIHKGIMKIIMDKNMKAILLFKTLTNVDYFEENNDIVEIFRTAESENHIQ